MKAFQEFADKLKEVENQKRQKIKFCKEHNFGYEVLWLQKQLNTIVISDRNELDEVYKMLHLLYGKEYKIVKYLIESGYCLSKNEKWLMDSTYSVKKIDKNALNWVKMNLKNPKTLMNICRQEIRKRLGNEYVNEKISCLNVTYNVKQYLLMRS